MSKNKTVPNKLSVKEFVREIENEEKREEMNALLSMMEKITDKKATMWGSSIIGFDQYHYKYDSGREGDMFLTGCSARKNNISIYVMAGLERYQLQLEKLGKHKIGKSCLLVKSLKDIDTTILEEIISDSVRLMKQKHH